MLTETYKQEKTRLDDIKEIIREKIHYEDNSENANKKELMCISSLNQLSASI